MRLFLTLTFLELKRLQVVLGILLFILLCFGSGLSCDLNDSRMGSEINLTFSQNGDRMDLGALPNIQKFMTLAPSFGLMVFSLLVGFVVLFTVPFRGRNEWESGNFHLFYMSDHSFYKIEVLRYLIQCLIFLVFFAIVQGAGAYAMSEKGVLDSQTIWDGILVNSYWFMTLCPLIFAFGGWVSAINTAYYRDGSGIPLNFAKILGIMGFLFVIIPQLGEWFHQPESEHLLPVFDINFLAQNVAELNFKLSLDWIVAIGVLITMFMVWSGRIYEEVES